mmetsp:Transcript_24885/g.45086  ORF Transcript_24885/g.45086 Transcript_24885/m.45086 type:complete len:240 (+) Transcript_24885:1725-2444(+)
MPSSATAATRALTSILSMPRDGSVPMLVAAKFKVLRPTVFRRANDLRATIDFVRLRPSSDKLPSIACLDPLIITVPLFAGRPAPSPSPWCWSFKTLKTWVGIFTKLGPPSGFANPNAVFLGPVAPWSSPPSFFFRFGCSGGASAGASSSLASARDTISFLMPKNAALKPSAKPLSIVFFSTCASSGSSSTSFSSPASWSSWACREKFTAALSRLGRLSLVRTHLRTVSSRASLSASVME